MFRKSLVALALVTFTLGGCAPSFGRMDPEAVQARGMRTEFPQGQRATFDAMLQAARLLGYSIDYANAETGVFTGMTGMSLVSYGERFAVNVAAREKGSEVFVVSELRMATNVFGDPHAVRNLILRRAERILEEAGTGN